jgi:hypothetical protein
MSAEMKKMKKEAEIKLLEKAKSLKKEGYSEEQQFQILQTKTMPTFKKKSFSERFKEKLEDEQSKSIKEQADTAMDLAQMEVMKSLAKKGIKVD